MKKFNILTLLLAFCCMQAYGQTEVSDTDGDTKIETERTADNDQIFFQTEGTDRWLMKSTRIEPYNSGNSIHIGVLAGENDDLTNNQNVFIGDQAGRNTTSGDGNVALGRQTLRVNTTGYGNMAIGALALNNNNGFFNVGIGSNALQFNTTGVKNMGIGQASLRDNTTGRDNVGIGANAFENNQTGNANLAMGSRAGFGITNGSQNVLLGFEAGDNAGLTSGNVMIGYQAGQNATGSNKLYIDNSNTTEPLIYGEFDNKELTVNGTQEIKATGLTGFSAPVLKLDGDIGPELEFRENGALKAEIASGFNNQDDLFIRNTTSSGQMLLTTNNLNRVSIKPTGEMQLIDGGTSPARAKLDVRGDATVDTDFTADFADKTLHVDATDNRVGIATDAPNYLLHLNSGVTTDDLGDKPSLMVIQEEAPGIMLYDDSPGGTVNDHKWIMQENSGDFHILFDGNTFDGFEDFLTILEDSGNVGLGNDDPQEKLDVNGNIHANGDLMADGMELSDELTIDLNSNTPTKHIRLVEEGATDYARIQMQNKDSVQYWTLAGRATNGAFFNFFYDDGTTGKNVARVHGSGDFEVDLVDNTLYVDDSQNSVGFGTDSPAGGTKIHAVGGSVRSENTSGWFDANGTTSQAGLRMYENGALTAVVRHLNGSDDLYIANSSTGNGNDIVIENDGKVGFNTSTATTAQVVINTDSGNNEVLRLDGDDQSHLTFNEGTTQVARIRAGFGTNDDLYIENQVNGGDILFVAGDSGFDAVIYDDSRAAFGEVPQPATNTQFTIEAEDTRIGLQVESGQNEVARFVSPDTDDPQIKMYRGNTFVNDLWQNGTSTVLTNRQANGDIIFRTQNGATANQQSLVVEGNGDIDVAGNIFLGSAENLTDAGPATIETNSSFRPADCGLRDLGSNSNQWDQVWIDNAVVTGSCFTSGGGSEDSFSDNEGEQYGLNEIMKLRETKGLKNNSNELNAADLLQVMPAVVETKAKVFDEETGELSYVDAEIPGIRITDFIPVLVKSVQEQQEIIEQKDQDLAQMKEEITLLRESLERLEEMVYNQVDTRSETHKGQVTLQGTEASLGQNRPNPYSEITRVDYYVPSDVQDAIMMITDMSGRVIKQVELQNGKGVLDINRGSLEEGTYNYSLVLDGRISSTHQMVIVK